MYEAIELIAGENRNKGPVLIGGDFNARLLKPKDEKESKVIGKHTFQKDEEDTDLPEDMQENRQLLISLCRNQELIATNTWYRKQETKLATFRKIGASRT